MPLGLNRKAFLFYWLILRKNVMLLVVLLINDKFDYIK